MNGCIGVHIEANSEGYSRDRAIETARRIGGKYAVVVNDNLLCQMLLDVGITPIHRINRQGFLDDNAHQKGYSARDYVRTAAIEVPDKRCLLYLNNEPGQNDLERLRDFMLEGIDEANKLGRTLVCFNWAYGNPEPETENVLYPVYEAIDKGEHKLGAHEGTDLAHPTLASCYPFLIGRFVPVMQRYGFGVIVTEYAASKDAHHGYQTWDSHFAESSRDTVREVYAPNNVYMTPFTTFTWQTGFAYVDDAALQSSWAETNRLYPVQESIPVPINPPTTPKVRATLTKIPTMVNGWINVRSQPDSNQPNDIGDLLLGDVCDIQDASPDNGWWYVTPITSVPRPAGRQAAAVGWTSKQNGAVAFTPEAPPDPPAEKTYTLTASERDVLMDYFTRIRDDAAAGLALVEGLPLSPDSRL